MPIFNETNCKNCLVAIISDDIVFLNNGEVAAATAAVV